MKSAGSNTLAALSASQFYKAELYDIALASGATLRLTDYDVPLTVGANTYLSNAIIERGSLTQRVGLDPDTLDLKVSPQGDAIAAPTVNGLPFLQAVKLGFLDSARVTMYKVFMQKTTNTDGSLPTNTSGEAVTWFKGRVSDASAGRQTASIVVQSDLALLNVSMPRNIVQPGCVHSLFDAGCTLNKAANTSSSTVSATGPNTAVSFTTALTQATDFFALGVITFTGGANAGISRTIKSYSSTSGLITLFGPLPNIPATSDAFTIVPGCDKQQGTCSSKFSNLAHFRGYPYVPVPETLYDGGSVQGPAPTVGGQGVPGVGSPWPGNIWGGYVP